MEHVASRGPRGRVPQGEIGEIYVPNHKSLQSRYVVVDIFIDEEYKLFMAKPGAKVLCMFLGGGGAPPSKREKGP